LALSFDGGDGDGEDVDDEDVEVEVEVAVFPSGVDVASSFFLLRRGMGLDALSIFAAARSPLTKAPATVAGWCRFVASPAKKSLFITGFAIRS